MTDKKCSKRYKKPEDKLTGILIYHKRKYIMPICLILYLALVLVSIVLTLGVAAYAGEEPLEVAKEIFRLSGSAHPYFARCRRTAVFARLSDAAGDGKAKIV